MSKDENSRTTIVVGAGVIGLSCAYHLIRAGHRVTIVDGSDEASPASLGNAGGIAVTECVPASMPGVWRRIPGWLFDPLGPLHLKATHAPGMVPWLRAFLAQGRMARVEAVANALASLNDRVYPALEPMLDAIGMADHLHRTGAMTVYRDRAAYEADALEWRLRADNGVRLETVEGPAVRELEPALGPMAGFGIVTPDWSIVSDPAEIVAGLRAHCLRAGATAVAGWVEALSPHSPETGRGVDITLTDGRRIEGEHVVIAGGAWSKALASQAGDRILLESERGYNRTVRTPGLEIGRQLTFGTEKFVATPLAPGLRIGGAAEFAGLATPPNFERSAVLARLAKRYLPGLDAQDGTDWMGHRPSTPDSLPVIGRSPNHPGVFYALGHGHLGLTQSAPTGQLIAQLVADHAPNIDMKPFAVERFAR